MSDDDALSPPAKGHPDDKIRTAIEAAVSVVPGASGVTRLLSDLVPTQAQRSRSDWEGRITERTNTHSQQIAEHQQQLEPKETLSNEAATLAVALAKDQACDGMAGRYRDMRALCILIPEVEYDEVEAAANELSMFGLVKITRMVGPEWYLTINPEFYVQIDHQVMGWNTVEDAAAIAAAWLADQKLQRAASLREAVGWPHRRFNPALRYMMRFIVDGWVSKEIQAEYPTGQIGPSPEDAIRLRKFVQSQISHEQP